MPDRLHPNDLVGKQVRWLLDLTYAGRVIRLSDAECEVMTDAGDSLHYAGALQGLDVTEGIDFLADGSASAASVSVDAVLPLDVAKYMAQGHDLSAATGILYRWIEGTTHESARVVIVGCVRDPEYGAEGEPVSFSLEANVWDDTSSLPDAGLTVTGSNWDDDMILSLDASELGLYYPIVIGQPGKVSTEISSSGWCTGSQAVWVDHRRDGADPYHHLSIVIAGHHVSAAFVYLNTSEYTTGHRFYVRNTYDFAGHPVAIVPWWDTAQGQSTPPLGNYFVYLAGGVGVGNEPYTYINTDPYVLGSQAIDSSFQPNDGEIMPVYVGWYDPDDSSAGGLRGNDGATMRGAGDVLEYLCSYSTIQIDRGRFAAAASLLNGFKLDFAIDAKTTAWQFVQANLLPILPCSVVSGPSGLYPIVWRYDATESDAICHLDTGIDPSVERFSSVTVDRSKIVNDFTLNYALSVRTGAYQAVARINAKGTDGAFPSYPCQVSTNRYRTPKGDPLVVAESMDTICIYDDATAYKVLAWRSRAYALARRRVTYLCPESGYGWLERGQVVTITDADLHFDRQVALIESIKTDGSPSIQIGLLLIEEMARDSRQVG